MNKFFVFDDLLVLYCMLSVFSILMKFQVEYVEEVCMD